MTCRNPDNCQKKDMRRMGKTGLCRPCAISKYRKQPEVIEADQKRLAAANYRKHWAWCPPEYREIYESMRKGSWTASEAKAEVLSWIRKEA